MRSYWAGPHETFTARALFYWSMLRAGFWMTEYFSISSILKRAPAQYTRAYLYCESDDGDASYFVAHQLAVLLKAIDGVHAYIARKQQAHSEAQTLLRPGSKLARRLNHRQRALLLNALRNPGKVYTIAVHQGAHDIAYDTARLVDQHEREATAATLIFGLLPDDQAVEFRALWDEFEARATADARFAHAIDRCQAMLLNCLSKGVTWSRHNVTVEQVRARNAPIGDGAAALWAHMRGLLDEAVRAGHLTEPASP